MISKIPIHLTVELVVTDFTSNVKYGAPPIEVPLPDLVEGPSVRPPPPPPPTVSKKDEEEQGQESSTSDGNYTAAKTLIEFSELISKLDVDVTKKSDSVVDASELD